MRTLIIHCKEYRTSFVELANRPYGIEPEEIRPEGIKNENCVVVLVCVEQGDTLKGQVFPLIEEIKGTAKNWGSRKIQITPFGHLSSKLASSKEAINAFTLMEEKLRDEFIVLRDHFGSHKTLLLDIFGHVGNIRFREF